MPDYHPWSCQCGRCPDPEQVELRKQKALRWYRRWGSRRA